jgi:hypothetical protein
MNQSPIIDDNFVPESVPQPLSAETVKSLQELGEVYRRIHRRLVSEGYVIRDGKIIPPATTDANHGNS